MACVADDGECKFCCLFPLSPPNKKQQPPLFLRLLTPMTSRPTPILRLPSRARSTIHPSIHRPNRSDPCHIRTYHKKQRSAARLGPTTSAPNFRPCNSGGATPLNRRNPRPPPSPQPKSIEPNGLIDGAVTTQNRASRPPSFPTPLFRKPPEPNERAWTQRHVGVEPLASRAGRVEQKRRGGGLVGRAVVRNNPLTPACLAPGGLTGMIFLFAGAADWTGGCLPRVADGLIWTPTTSTQHRPRLVVRAVRWIAPAAAPLQEQQQAHAQHTPKAPSRHAVRAASSSSSRHPSAMGNTKSSSSKRVRTRLGARRRPLPFPGRLEGGRGFVVVLGPGAPRGGSACVYVKIRRATDAGPQAGIMLGGPRGAKGAEWTGLG